MTAALQHLLNKIILITDSGCCVSINVTHTANAWELHISNNVLPKKENEGACFLLFPLDYLYIVIVI